MALAEVGRSANSNTCLAAGVHHANTRMGNVRGTDTPPRHQQVKHIPRVERTEGNVAVLTFIQPTIALVHFNVKVIFSCWNVNVKGVV